MSNLDMSEAIRLLAQEKGLSVDALLHVMVDALASAYKRRPGAADEVVVEVNPESMEFTFVAYDVDEDGNWVNERDDTPKKEELGRIAAQTFRQVMSQRIREVESERKFEEYANREGDIVTPEGERSERRLQGVLVAADERSATIQLNDAAQTERTVPYEKIDRAKTVFEWGPAPKPGKTPPSKTSRESRVKEKHSADEQSGGVS